jgi:hypothetical protein
MRQLEKSVASEPLVVLADLALEIRSKKIQLLLFAARLKYASGGNFFATKQA